MCPSQLSFSVVVHAVPRPHAGPLGPPFLVSLVLTVTLASCSTDEGRAYGGREIYYSKERFSGLRALLQSLRA